MNPHSMNQSMCPPCGDLEGCWWPHRIRQAKNFAEKKHDGQKYGVRPFMFHLGNVVRILQEYDAPPELLAAGWLHDIVEDCDVTILDVMKLFGEPISFGFRVAEPVLAVTNVDGKPNWKLLARTPGAVMLKLADRTTNSEQCKIDGLEIHLKRYREQQIDFRKLRVQGEHDDLWNRLEEALK